MFFVAPLRATSAPKPQSITTPFLARFIAQTNPQWNNGRGARVAHPTTVAFCEMLGKAQYAHANRP